jgi:hypothetical protein
MKTLPMPGGFERFSERSDVEHAQDEITMAVEALNDTLSYTSRSYDGVISFAHERGESIALPLANANAYNAAPERYEFRSQNIVGRRLLLAGTALKKVLRPQEPLQFIQSAINPSSQFTYAQPLWHDNQQVGALQYSFTPESSHTSIEDLPSNDQMLDLHKDYHREVGHIAAQMAYLQRLARETKGTKSLATGLELEQPIAPNAYVIRWDIRASSHFVTSDLGPVYDAFIGQAHAALRDLTHQYIESSNNLVLADVHEAYDDQGDGAYIILPLLPNFNPYDRRARVNFEQDRAKGFIRSLDDSIRDIARQYHRTFTPEVVITGDFGYVEENTIGRLTSRTMHTLANQQKEK